MPEKTDRDYELRSRGRAILGFEALDRVRIDPEVIIVMIEWGAVGIGGERLFSSQLVA